MPQREDKPSDRSRGIYSQVQCSVCDTLIYGDQAMGDERQPMCNQCFADLAVAKTPFLPHQIRVPIVGVSLLELLLIAGIIGVLLATVVRPILNIKDIGDTRKLEAVLFGNNNPEIVDAANGFFAAGQHWDDLIENAARVAGVPDEEVAEFEKDLRRYEKYDSKEAKAGSLIKTIESWKKRMVEKRAQDPLLLGDEQEAELTSAETIDPHELFGDGSETPTSEELDPNEPSGEDEVTDPPEEDELDAHELFGDN